MFRRKKLKTKIEMSFINSNFLEKVTDAVYIVLRYLSFCG